MASAQAARLTRFAALLLMAGTLLFAFTAGALQLTRTDLNPVAMPLSAYLTGPGGIWLRSVYDVIGAGLVAFGVITYWQAPPTARSGLAAWLFIGAGLAMPVVAASELYAGSPYASLARFAHLMAAQSTFLWLSIGTLLLSYRWRRDPLRQPGARVGCTLAWLATAVLWLQVFARQLPSGLMQKLAISLILLWLAWAARQLWRTAARSET